MLFKKLFKTMIKRWKPLVMISAKLNILLSSSYSVLGFMLGTEWTGRRRRGRSDMKMNNA